MTVRELFKTYGLNADDNSITSWICWLLFPLISMMLSEHAGNILVSLIVFMVSFLLLYAGYALVRYWFYKHK